MQLSNLQLPDYDALDATGTSSPGPVRARYGAKGISDDAANRPCRRDDILPDRGGDAGEMFVRGLASSDGLDGGIDCDRHQRAFGSDLCGMSGEPGISEVAITDSSAGKDTIVLEFFSRFLLSADDLVTKAAADQLLQLKNTPLAVPTTLQVIVTDDAFVFRSATDRS